MHRLSLSWFLCGLAAFGAAAGCNDAKSKEADGGAGANGGASGQGGSGAGGAGGSGGGGVGGAGGHVATCAFSSTYTIVNWSGPDTSDLMTLSPATSFHYRGETPYLDDGGVSYQTCDAPLPACDDPSRIDVSDVEAAIAHPDVQAALVATTSWYGSRIAGPSGGAPWLDFQRSDPSGGFRAGGAIGAGADCPTPSPTCVPTPPGIHALVDLLRALRQQQCAGVR